AAIRRAFTEPGLMETMARNGWDTFQNGYTEDKVVGQYRAFFERVVAEKVAEKAAEKAARKAAEEAARKAAEEAAHKAAENAAKE
ncbi:MAG: hypothetical protein K9H25_14910, partial [Rhodospirillum sp.]|nr:hypothetical protein [Rhodospirillum sp.]